MPLPFFSPQKSLAIAAGILAFCLLGFGFSAGALTQKILYSQNAAGLEILETSEPILTVPVIRFEKIENGILYGHNNSAEARFIIGENTEEIFVEQSGNFSFPVTPILPNLAMIPAPEGSQFVASSRGTKYWPLDAPQAALISVKNRTFFISEEDAIAKGYSRGK